MQKWLGGVTHIICLTRLCQHRLEYFEKVGHEIEIFHYYLHDDGKPKPFRYWATIVTYGTDVINNGGKLLVHCAAGRNRSTSAAYAILRSMQFDSKTAEKLILDNYAKKMVELENDPNNPGRYRPLQSIRYKDDVESFLEKTKCSDMKWYQRLKP